MSQQTQRMAHVVQERRRRRSSREQPFGHFPRDFGSSDDLGGSVEWSKLTSAPQAQGKSRAPAPVGEKTHAAASALSGTSMLGATFSGWGASVEDDMLAGGALDDSVSTGGPGDFAGVSHVSGGSARSGGGGGGTREWHWRTG